jgi:hypothetical protein
VPIEALALARADPDRPGVAVEDFGARGARQEAREQVLGPRGASALVRLRVPVERALHAVELRHADRRVRDEARVLDGLKGVLVREADVRHRGDAPVRPHCPAPDEPPDVDRVARDPPDVLRRPSRHRRGNPTARCAGSGDAAGREGGGDPAQAHAVLDGVEDLPHDG